MSASSASELLERDAEVGTLTEWLERARTGTGGLLVIEGEAGVGKTALLERCNELGAAQGITVLAARGGELEREFAWGIVRQLFEPLVVGASEGDQILFEEAAALARPALGLQAGAASGEATSFATLHGLYWLTVNIARRRPVLIAVDDLHWADHPSLRFLVHLAPRIVDLPIALLAAMRPVGSEPSADAALLARLVSEPGSETIHPAALSEPACTQLVRDRLSTDANEDFCLACFEMSRGNPFLLQSLIDSLQAEGADPMAAGAAHVRQMTPGAVSRSVLVRLATMPRGALELARAIAVLGTRAELRRARRLAGLEPDEAVEIVGALARSGILRGDSVVEFVHPLVRAAVYADLTPAEQGRWHERIAQLLIADGVPSEELIPHLLTALPDGDQRKVRELRGAAAHARAGGAPEVAIDCLERALAEPPEQDARADVLLELGQVRAMLDPAAAVAPLAEAFAAGPSGARRAKVALALGDTLTLCGRLSEAIPVLEQGLAELAGESTGLRAPLEAGLIAAARWEGSAQVLRHQTVDEIRGRWQAGERLDPRLHCQLAIETTALGEDRDSAIHHARGAIAAADDLSIVGASTVPEAALVLAFADLAEEARRATVAWLALARRIGWPLGIATASTCDALSALYRGAVSEAIASARGSITPGSEIRLAPIAVAFLIEALIERGEIALARSELAERQLDGTLPETWATTPLLLARGRLHAASGDHPEAARDLLATGERAEAWGVRNPAMIPWRSSAAVSLAALGERAEAVRLASEELALAHRWGAPRAIGVALRAAGIAHGGDEGLALLRQSAAVLEDSVAPVERARAHTELGAALRRRGDRAEAREQLRRGLDLAHHSGATALADRARDELTVAGARPRRDALRGRDSLTASELRVADLAADGHTNNQIAQALFVTPRTVETHLTNAYAKLGIRSRHELPAALEGSG